MGKDSSESAPLITPEDTIIQDKTETVNMSTTQFVDDSTNVSRDESHVTHIDMSIMKVANSQPKNESILEFLMKPIVFTSGTFALTDTYSVFNSFSMPHSAFLAGNGGVWTSKLAGFFGIRMDMRFKIVVNANKFQQGRYIMGWTPLGGPKSTTSNLKNLLFVQAHNSTLVQRTTVPHVELDLATNTTAELLIPFASAALFYPLNTIWANSDVSPLGFLNIYPYDALKAPSGSTVCGYTVYVSFENVSLYGAASPQAGISSKEVSNKNNGPISSTASAVSRGFNEFSNIPLIGEYAKGVSWISDRIAKTASIFGFSKPTAGDCVPKMMMVNAPSHATVDGESDARSLSFMNAPGVVPIKGLAGTDYDEMDFSYIKSKYAWFRTFAWTTSSTVNSTLSSIDVYPNVGVYSTTASGIGITNYAPVAFIANQFTWWRGSLKFRFKIVKTEYHSGRLQFAFYPRDEGTYVGNPAYVNREIVDVREHSEVELVVPYISRFPWSLIDAFTGSLVITVIDQLVAPSSVSPTINILCEISGGSDFEVAVPANFVGTPTFCVPQSGLNDEKLIMTNIGNSVINSSSEMFSSLTIGDKVSSVRPLLRRYSPINRAAENSNGSLNKPTFRIVPDAVLFFGNSAFDPASGIIFNADSLSVWASCYLFMSGGVRIRDNLNCGLVSSSLHINSSTIVSMVIDSSSERYIIQDYTTPPEALRNLPRIMQDTSTNNTVSVEVPQYTAGLTRVIPDIIIYQKNGLSSYDDYTLNSSGSPVRLIFRSPAGMTITPVTGYTFHNVYRSGADDLTLSGFVSIPPFKVLANQDFGSSY